LSDLTFFSPSDPVNDAEQPRLDAERHVFLTGFMGAGKTTAGRLLAETLRRPFVDMDEELEKSHQKSVQEIFGSFGEDFFRAAESALLLTLMNRDRPLVVSTGGGLVEDAANRQALKSALTFFLDVPPEIAWGRLNTEQKTLRPLAQDWAHFKKRHSRRRPLYLECGRVTPASQTPEQVVEYIRDYVLEEPPLTLTAEGHTSTIRTYVPSERLESLVSNLIGQRRILAVTDHFFKDKTDAFAKAMPQAKVYHTAHRGEGAKTLAEASEILSAMADSKLDRSDFLIARGGGSLTDLGGFCAGLFRRGLNLVLAPTTLLGAVDAAVGGKTAVNLRGAKNQAGLFHLPREVWIDPWILAELPSQLTDEGLVEAFKTGLLFDIELSSLINRQLENIRLGDLPLLTEVIHRSAKAKAALVEKDFREEKSIRDVLNLGHTYGHVIESFHAPQVSHGKAVAFGLAVALEFSRLNQGLDPDTAKAASCLCFKLSGGRFPPNPPAEAVKSLLGFDKKIRAGRLKFVALTAPGQPVVVEAEPSEVIKAAETVAKTFQSL
jgi:3-dehydroquinate synthetase/shikimate kinase